jgi:uncharacterized membrane protein YGL010W
MNEHDLIAEYSSSHQNQTNQLVHYICVPVIFFNVVAFLYAASPFLALGAGLAALVFYYRTLRSFFPLMIAFVITCLVTCYLFAPLEHFLRANMVLFVVAWIGQFWGHKVEGKNPSFFRNIFFLLVGPAWVLAKFRANIAGKW